MSPHGAAFVCWLVVLVAAGLGALPLVPPAPSANPNGAAFSADRALGHVERVAVMPRPIGSPANTRTRELILDELRALHLAPELQAVDAPDYYGGSPLPVAVVNVVARIPGTASTAAVALVAHYDSVPGSPGANDDAVGVAVLLESARAILAGARLRNDVILVFTDGEEPAPRFGSRAFVSEHPWSADVGFVVNLEALGGGGPSMLTATSGPDAWIADELDAALPYPVAYSFLTATARLVGDSSTDFASFRDAGIPGVEFAYLHGSPIYHTAADRPDRVGRNSLHQQGANTLALTRRIGDLDLNLAPTPGDTVFFTVGRYSVLRYPVSWSFPVAVLAGFVLAVAAWLRRRGSPAPAALVRAPATLLLAVLLSALVAVAFWWLVATRRPTMGSDESYAYLAFLTGTTIVVSGIVARFVAHGGPVGERAVGVVGAWWVLAVLTSLAAPEFSYVFVWPALAGAVALAWTASTLDGKGTWRQLAGLALVAGTALVLLVPVIDTFFQAAQPRPGNPDSELLWLISIPVALLALVVELVRSFWASERASG
jgi:hypothetical protein